MKLIHKINTQFFIALFTIMILLGMTLTIALRKVFEEQIDEKLEHSYQLVVDQIQNNSSIGSISPYFLIDTIDYASDTIYYSNERLKVVKRKHDEDFKVLTAIKNIKTKTYKIIIRESEMETDDLYESIISIVLIAFFLIVVALYFINRKIAQSVWSVFYANLSKLKSFSLHNQKTLEFENTEILEFSELNSVMTSLTNKVVADYKNLKQFSEDASHELQTPLAIIRSKLEALIDTNELSKEQIDKIQSIYDAANRLGRLNKDLLLLAKIENKQFDENKTILINEFIEKKVDDWQEMIELKQLELTLQIQNPLKIQLAPNLIDILLSNLLSNAINHNIHNGKIFISISGNTLKFANTGEMPIKNPESIFNRFHKENQSSQSIGLGLAIVKKICQTHQIHISYSYIDGMHVFTLSFNFKNTLDSGCKFGE